jgi:ABC-type oligopeptide transport system substrate-binding subunit
MKGAIMMKKVPKKLLLVGLIALLCAVILSACGKNNTQNNKLPAQSDPTPESITPDTPKSTVGSNRKTHVLV